jgi:hypothetical protein
LSTILLDLLPLAEVNFLFFSVNLTLTLHYCQFFAATKIIKMELPQLPKVVTILCISTFLSTKSQETDAPKFGNGLFNLVRRDSTWSLKIGLRFQTLATNN